LFKYVYKRRLDLMDYDLNVGRFIRDHPGYILRVGFLGFGYEAQHRDERGHGVGERYSALTLDELAAMLVNADAQA
jgi:hypothetical protein